MRMLLTGAASLRRASNVHAWRVLLLKIFRWYQCHLLPLGTTFYERLTGCSWAPATPAPASLGHSFSHSAPSDDEYTKFYDGNIADASLPQPTQWRVCNCGMLLQLSLGAGGSLRMQIHIRMSLHSSLTI